MKRVIVLSFVICLILTWSGSWGYKPMSNSIDVSFENGQHINVEVANTLGTMRNGLMFREDLGTMEGMIFMFEREDLYAIWMKNMRFSIDVIWLDEDLRIVHIEEDAPPCENGACPSYLPEVPAKYVLEVESGFVEQNGIAIGERVSLNRPVANTLF
ncbi:MAG: DUF192 domain-containing protein [Candidatus Hydrothermarchaeales archaeon]